MPKRALNLKMFKPTGKTAVYRGRLFKLTHVKIDAPNRPGLRYDVIEHPGAAVIIPVTAEGELILIRQYRPAVGKIMYEFPAGTLEPGEEPLMCAKREIVEEIGFRAKTWRRIAAFYPTPGISTECMHLFAARNLERAVSNVDSDEFLESVIMSRKRLGDMIRSGKIKDAKTMIGYYMYQRSS